jgi:crossover junction endodeoxyribonuclease RuvC
MKVLGIDPGITGALVFYSLDQESISGVGALSVHDMPVMGSGKRKVVSGALVADVLRKEQPHHAFIEEVTSMRGWGLASTFRFGVGNGVVIGALAALRIPLEPVKPTTWKRHFLLIGQDKKASRRKAIELWPTHAEFFAREKDDGRAEAALIARYGYVRMRWPA